MPGGFERVATTAEVSAGSMKLVTVNGQQVCLGNAEGSYFAVGNECTHMGGSLHQGALVDQVVRCPDHGSEFHVGTGRAVVGPARRPVKVYRVRVEGNDIRVSP